MADILQDWINDASAYELLNTYRIEQQVVYPFVNNSEDFYISLLNRLFFTLRDNSIDSTSKKSKLLQLVKGLLLYSEDVTAGHFKGVNRNNNLLYISAIYFLCEYNALASLFMRRANLYSYESESSQLLYCIMASSIKYAKENPYCDMLKEYMDSGDEEVLGEIEYRLAQKIENNIFHSLDDFFDTHIAIAVMARFRTSNLWRLLKPFGGKEFWGEYVAYSVKNNIFALLPSQEDAVSKGLLSYSRSFSLKMPTSAGKTFLTELLVYQEIKRNHNAKILYLAPLRSLSRELKERYGKLSAEFGFDFRAAYGGCTTSVEEETIENAKLLIATPETFTTLEGTIDDLIDGYTLIICDEGQLLEDKTRGVSYELLLTRLKRNHDARFLFISAIIPNISDINQWLGGNKEEVGDSKYRPCKIRFALASKIENHLVVQYANDAIKEYSVSVNDFLNEAQTKCVGPTQKSMSCALALKSMEAGPVMLYCSMKDWNRGCIAHAEEVLKLLSKPAFRKPASFVKDTLWLAYVTEYFTYQLGADYRLTKCIKEGFAYHHGQMPQDLRELIEISIAKKTLQLIVCTKTLSEGINMPIKTAVLANITNPADETYRSSLELRDLKNIVGRVGRAGKESYGLVMLPTKGNNEEPIRKVVSVLMDNVAVERANGSLYYIVQRIIEKQMVTDDEINGYLESEGVAESIDMLINLNQEDVELENVNLDEILEDSLAHYLGNEETKAVVKRVFNIRYSHLRNTLSGDEYRKYIKLGLPLADYKELIKALQGKAKDDFIIDCPTSGNWIHFIMETIYKMGSIKRHVSQLSETKPLYSIHRNLKIVERIVSLWIAGKQYLDISEEAGCSTEQAVLYVDFIQKTVSIKSRAIVTYIIDAFGVECPLLYAWPDMAKRGVSDERALLMIDSGLGDRILVNILAEYAKSYFPSIVEKGDFENMVVRSDEIDSFVMNLSIPELLKERWRQYLKSKARMYEWAYESVV